MLDPVNLQKGNFMSCFFDPTGPVIAVPEDCLEINSKIDFETDEYLFYVTVPIEFFPSSFNDVKINLNQVDDIPIGSFIFDYFGSGEIFINPLENVKIAYAKPSFVALIRNNFYTKNQKSAARQYPTESDCLIHVDLNENPDDDDNDDMGKYVLTYPYKRYGDGVYSWIFEINEFFQLEEVSQFVETTIPVDEEPLSINALDQFFTKYKKIDIKSLNKISENMSENSIVCKYFTVDAVGVPVKIVSKNYPFANIVPNTLMCSSPIKAPGTSSIHYCSFGLSGHHECEYYAPREEIVQTVLVNLENTTNSKDFMIVKSLDCSQQYTIKLLNKTDNVTLNQFTVSADKIEESELNAQNILNEYLSCYTNADITTVETDVEENVEVPSYILSIVGK